MSISSNDTSARQHFYALTDAEQCQRLEVLGQRALLEWGFDNAQLKLLKHRENSVFLVTRADDSLCVMRIHRADYHSNRALASELQWMSALNEFGIHTPCVIEALDGALFKCVQVTEVPEPRQVDLLSFVPGTPLGSIEQDASAINLEQMQSSYQTVGRILAQMHNFSAQWQLPADFARHAWDTPGLLGEQPWWGAFWEMSGLSEEQRARIFLARDKAFAQLQAYGQSGDRYGLVHADPLPENFLVDATGTIRIIDFDDAGFGWFLFDFATAMFVHLGQEHFDPVLASLIEGYSEFRPLPPEFEETLLLFLLLRGFTYLGWVHTRSETDTAKAMSTQVVEGVMQLVDAYLG